MITVANFEQSFIDMTSHEMRNPLSAIVQCADSIAASLTGFDCSKGIDLIMSKDDVESNLDAAQTIALCAQHQTRIIDDVLTLSKLDSSLLHITPVECQPAVVVENSLKIFDGELRKNDVELRLVGTWQFIEIGNLCANSSSRISKSLIQISAWIGSSSIRHEYSKSSLIC